MDKRQSDMKARDIVRLVVLASLEARALFLVFSRGGLKNLIFLVKFKNTPMDHIAIMKKSWGLTGSAWLAVQNIDKIKI